MKRSSGILLWKKENNQYYESFLVKKTMRENYNLKEYIDYGYRI